MANDNQILPELDITVLKEKATEFAMKGAIESIEEFYSGYNSPFRKQIDEQLKKQQTAFSLNLPDIIALLNEGLTKEIELIANTAVSKTFVPMVQKFLVREEKEIGFSDILKQFIIDTKAKNSDECEVSIKKSEHGWLEIYLNSEEYNCEFVLHTENRVKDGEEQKYVLLSLPSNRKHAAIPKTMTVSLDGATLELPFTRDVLSDEFTSYIARLVIGRCIITMDCRDFREDMFPEDDQCHC